MFYLQFYEAQVDFVPQGMPTCVVMFTEYGNREEVLLQDIRPVLPQMVRYFLLQFLGDIVIFQLLLAVTF